MTNRILNIDNVLYLDLEDIVTVSSAGSDKFKIRFRSTESLTYECTNKSAKEHYITLIGDSLVEYRKQQALNNSKNVLPIC